MAAAGVAEASGAFGDVECHDDSGVVPGLAKTPLMSLEKCVDAMRADPELAQLLDADFATAVKLAIMFAQCATKRNGEPLSMDEAAALHLYTQQTPLYPELNRRLAIERYELKHFLPFIKLLHVALYKLPASSMHVYRGVAKDLRSKFQVDSEKTWYAFTSTTTQLGVLKNPQFLGNCGARTLFHVEAVTAFDIRAYSAHPNESEVCDWVTDRDRGHHVACV